MAHEYDRADSQALELLARAFERMGLEEKARKVEAVLAEMSQEEPTLPRAVDLPPSRSDPGQ
jgi:outer membrane protein assembly factor BamD (BamD/ComL family)